VNLKRNANLSLISIAKIDPNPRSIKPLYFESVIDGRFGKVDDEMEDGEEP
jgi:hypothetical protein